MRRGFLRVSRAGWWWCCSWPCSGRARPGWWSGAYGGGWIGVMRSSSRSGSWRPVRALAWWGRALSGTTAVLPVPVSCWSGSGARVVCQVFWFCSVGCGVTVLLVGGGRRGRTGTSSAGPRTAWCAALFRGLHAAGPGLVLGAGLSLAVWAFRPWSNRALTWVVAQAMRLVVAGSLRCSSNGSGGSGFGPHRGGSSRYEESDRCSASDRVFTASRIAGTSQNSAWTPAWEGRPGQDGPEFFLLCAGGFRRVPVSGVAGQDRAHPGGLPLGQPFLHCPLSALNNLWSAWCFSGGGRK